MFEKPISIYRVANGVKHLSGQDVKQVLNILTSFYFMFFTSNVCFSLLFTVFQKYAESVFAFKNPFRYDEIKKPLTEGSDNVSCVQQREQEEEDIGIQRKRDPICKVRDKKNKTIKEQKV